jgi:tRNA threonylcarbamoyladenosine biosynthesis protein TsaE
VAARKKETVKTPVTIRSSSSEETHRIGIEIGKTLVVPGVVLLRGTLGMGKTTLTRGIAGGLGLADTDRVCSPSFTLINIYQGRCPIYHVDLYRLSGTRDLYSIGIDDFIGKDGVTIVEWSERLTGLFPGAVEIEITDAGGDSRILGVSGGLNFSPAVRKFTAKTQRERKERKI